MKPLFLFTLISLVGFTDVSPAQKTELTELQKAHQSVFLLRVPSVKSTGTGVLVGREKTEGGYKYKAVSAYHVLGEAIEKALTDKTNINLEFMFQQSFHGDPLRKHVEATIEWAVEKYDWVCFSFLLEEKMHCCEIATEEEFQQIQPFENIYGVGCDDGKGQSLKIGVIGSTHNHEYYGEFQTLAPQEWNRNPNKFFRAYMNIWLGSSGGGIFNKDGKLIGIFIAINILNPIKMPVPHGTICLKAHVIKSATDAIKDFIRIEE